MKSFLLICLLHLLCPNPAYSQDTGSIYDTGSERIGYWHKEDTRIDVFDKSWERKGYIILKNKDQEYYNKAHGRIDPDTLLRELNK